MRKMAVLLLLSGIAFPTFAQKQVTVEELEQALDAVHGNKDAEIARQLSDLVLTERLSVSTLGQLNAGLTGDKSRRALLALADSSAFLERPVAEIPATVAPDADTQHKLIALAMSYVETTLRRMPDFTATKNTTRFEDTPQPEGATGAKYQPLHFSGRSSATVFYLGGKEVASNNKRNNRDPNAGRLDSLGEFGPILSMVMADAAPNNVAWSHWEQGTAGLEAIFRYDVPTEKSHYEVNYCCVSVGDFRPLIPYRQIVAYYGEIAIDHGNGTILRLTVETAEKRKSPLSMTGTLVEYGPVDIDGNAYICPLKSVSLTRASIVLYSNGYSTGKAGRFDSPRQKLLNDVTFEHYRRFGSESRILTGDRAARD